MGEPNTTPYEIIGAPFTVWRAPVGTAFPLIDAAPAVDWIKVGSNGSLNYAEDGVKVSHPQALNFFRALGDSGSRKAFRTSEDLKIMLTLVDMTLEQYRLGLNNNTVTTVAAGGEAGYKKIGLSRGLSVATMALLVRGPSAYLDDAQAQYEIPICVQSGTPEAVFKRGDPAALALEWTALVDATAAHDDERFGRLVIMTAVAIS